MNYKMGNLIKPYTKKPCCCLKSNPQYALKGDFFFHLKNHYTMPDIIFIYCNCGN